MKNLDEQITEPAAPEQKRDAILIAGSENAIIHDEVEPVAEEGGSATDVTVEELNTTDDGPAEEASIEASEENDVIAEEDVVETAAVEKKESKKKDKKKHKKEKEKEKEKKKDKKKKDKHGKKKDKKKSKKKAKKAKHKKD